ncbi:hypothetical protein WJX72_005240 [[Myrmecia] bisecta]|uniref:Uncharacterized protein n=1 Tax=[Myrmecia] bisecta TaxID=41462 RepID=A0AAW1PLP0_9CHLO
MSEKQAAEPPEVKRPLGRSAQSLGWLSQSSVQPKKQRIIEGVSASSLVDLKAQLYKTQEEARLVKEGKLDPESRGRRTVGIDLSLRNAGVEERDKRDKLHIKTKDDVLQDSRAALERKAALYDKLAAGWADDDEELYNVDFLRKGFLVDERVDERHRTGEEAVDSAAEAINAPGFASADMQRERERRDWEEASRRETDAAAQQEELRRAKREAINELVEETRVGREAAAAQKQQRQQAAEKTREKLKAAFLKRQVQALKAAKAGATKQGA